ncbi:MAG: ATP-dependent helicase [Candidatus Limnocylindrales bacterium]
MPAASALDPLLSALSPDQLAAVTAPPGPTLCVAPAGSGKTTTLVARVAWRLAQGTPAEVMCALTFNRRAAGVLRERLVPVLEARGLPPDAVRVRTFHALGREILAAAGRPVEPLVDRPALLRELSGGHLGPATVRRLDDQLSRLKLEPRAGPPSPLLATYQAALARTGALDADDLVAGAIELLVTRPSLLATWQRRCGVLLVDEVQDLDLAQWRLARLLTLSRRDLFAVGDDDQTIYAWRLADARRMIGLARSLPGVRRVDLRTNYRNPPAVVERAVGLIGRNRERLAKTVVPRQGATGRLILAADPGDDVARARALLRRWAPDVADARMPGTHAVLARTNAELAPFAAVAVELSLPYRAEDDGLHFDPADGTSARAWRARLATPHGLPPTGSLVEPLRAAAVRRDRLRRADAALVLSTIHATKGLEFEVVACVGLDEGRFPSRRNLEEAPDARRALEEERRLAYVAWTRPRRDLYLVYDPGAPSPFVREAFSAAEQGRAAGCGLLVVEPAACVTGRGWRGRPSGR